MLDKVKLLGVQLTNESEEKVSEYVLEELLKSKQKAFIVTPNPELLVYAQAHPAYRDILNKAAVALPDGVGIVWGASLMGKPVKSRITGTDFIETLCRDSKEKPVSMGFLGGRGNVAERSAQCLKKKYPWLDVVFVGEEWPDTVQGREHGAESKNKLYALRPTPYANIDILFVAFGFPKQEEWIAEHLEDLPVKVAMGVGGAFDYLSGEVARAPKFIRALGFEWLFRLIRQPWRIKRQLALLKFIYLILKEKLS